MSVDVNCLTVNLMEKLEGWGEGIWKILLENTTVSEIYNGILLCTHVVNKFNIASAYSCCLYEWIFKMDTKLTDAVQCDTLITVVKCFLCLILHTQDRSEAPCLLCSTVFRTLNGKGVENKLRKI